MVDNELKRLISGYHQKVSIDPRWVRNHRKPSAAPKRTKILFLGDSIINDWLEEGRRTWNKKIRPLISSLMGFDGEGVLHILWRVQHGEIFKGIKPKLVVVNIGTNDLNRSPEDIAIEILRLLSEIRMKVPKAKILIFGIFPVKRGFGVHFDKKIRKINKWLQQSIQEEKFDGNIFFLDIKDALSSSSGKLKQGLYRDKVHLSKKGYQVWFEEMKNLLNVLAD